MRIDPTYGLGPSGTAPGGAQTGKPKPAAQPATDEAAIPDNPEIRHRYEKYLKQAAAGGQVDQRAIAEARELLASGKLLSDEAVRRAAQAIIDLGP